jgi:hypothetical protein
MDTNIPICQQLLKVHYVYSSNFAGAAEGNPLLLE